MTETVTPEQKKTAATISQSSQPLLLITCIRTYNLSATQMMASGRAVSSTIRRAGPLLSGSL